MKPDGVATAALEPMETLESNPVAEAPPPLLGEESDQAANPTEEVTGQQPTGGTGGEEGALPPPEPTKEAPAAKTQEPKGKTANKTAKTKTGPGSRPNTAQSRLTNGVSKPQTNGLAKKTTSTTADKKTTSTSTATSTAASKKPAGALASKTTAAKAGEKKPTGLTRPSTTSSSTARPSTTSSSTTRPSTTSSTTGAAAAKKTQSTTSTTTTTAAGAAKKPTAPKPASAAPAKPSSAALPKPDRPPVSKTTRPSTGTAASRPATASSRPATASTARSATSTAKPAPPKTTSTVPKAAATKTASATPSAGKTLTSQASKTAAPAKKDVTKPTTPAAKKPAASPLTRPSPAAKSTKPETPKSASKPDTTTKKPAASKAADTKSPAPKSKPTPSKDATKAPSSKLAATKTASPKKAVGSSTPTPVKRGPKTATLVEPAESGQKGEKEAAAAAVVAAAAIATAAAALVRPGEPEPSMEAPAVQETEPASVPPLSAQLDLLHLGEGAGDSVPPLGTTVMSPPCSPPGPMSPVMEASPMLDMHVQRDPWDQSQPMGPSAMAPHGLATEEMTFQSEEEEKENLFMPKSTAPSADAFGAVTQPDLLGGCPADDFASRSLLSPHGKEEAVEKADEEINEDVDDDEDEEDEEQRRLGHHPSSMFTEMSSSQPSDDFQVKSNSYGGSAGWHGEDLLSGLDSEDVSSSSSRQQGVSDLSSTQHTALLEGTQSSDALVDSSLRGSEGDGNFMGSPNVETLANEEEEDEDEEERVDDMDVSSERAEDQHKVFQQQEHEEEEDEDVEMPSEGVTESGLESCGNADEDDFNEEERLDNLNRSAMPPIPPSSAWGQTNPFSDPWAQPALLHASSPSPSADPETPTRSPAQAWLDSSAPSFAPQSEWGPQGLMESSAPEEPSAPPAAPAPAMSQSSTLSGPALAAHSSSETSTPDELRDYDSSSGVESHSDKRQTPVPSAVHPDTDQDLGIHLEKGDGEEEEAETLPADEVPGAGPPTAPASAPSSPSTSGDEASDTEGEMQINDPDAPPARDLPALDEDEEAAEAPAADGEEDGGGAATPQSANSVASYGFDCTTSNSNAHSTSPGKSPGIFSLENEDQLPEEAKDPSLIKELTQGAGAQAEDLLLGRPVDLMPLGGLEDHHYMLGGKMMLAGDDLEEVDPLEPAHHHLGAPQHPGEDGQPPYYSAICDKTDSFLAGNV